MPSWWPPRRPARTWPAWPGWPTRSAAVRPPDTDGEDDGFRDRSLRLSPYYHGNGQLAGNLTSGCAAALRAVLDALAVKAGPDDLRSQDQRDHDALQEALQRLLAARCLPERLAATLLHPAAPDQPARPAPPEPGTAAPDPGTAARELILTRATRLLSGPHGLAAWLRTRLTPGPAASMNQPLDIGLPAEIIPAHLRRAVVLRDRHCAFPGCERPPAACHVHHIVPRSEGGLTSLTNCILACPFHHLIAIHRWGWHIRLNPDTTKTATSPDGSRVLHSHGPPPGQAA